MWMYVVDKIVTVLLTKGWNFRKLSPMETDNQVAEGGTKICKSPMLEANENKFI